MTAIVSVLNKHAVAIAADSAVTMGNTHKVINSANKIFTLSKYHPVAVMTYNNASFMGVPWDIIIKEYRRELGNKNFPHLEDYITSFIEYLHQRNCFCDEQTQHEYFKILLSSFYDICCSEICRENEITLKNIKTEQIEEKFKQSLLINKEGQKCPEFISYDFSDFLNFSNEDILEFAKSKGLFNYDLLAESFFHYLGSKLLTAIFTGLVFVGYGEEEIYPSLVPLNISIVVDNHLKYYINERDIAKITDHGPTAFIVPFAQVDVTQTIIRGINPSFQNIIYNVIEKSIKAFSDVIINIVDKSKDKENIKIISAIKELDFDKIIDTMTSQINKEMRDSYTTPLLNTVVNLDKEDMANMAESFISLTSLVRRMQPGEETVGGPVDVAVLSKGDGFIWINRKHYFKPELNAHFFNNYFK